MRRLRRGVASILDFIVGDDWVTAVGVVVALGVTAVADDSAAAWVVMPIAVGLLLATSVRRAARSGEPSPTARRPDGAGWAYVCARSQLRRTNPFRTR